MQLTGIAHQIWDEKYRLKDNDGKPVDHTVEDTFKRVAVALASVEATDAAKERYTTEFYDALADFSVLPGGRILAGAGAGRYVTMLNCFHSPRVPDSLDGIHDVLKWGALTMQAGGGLGTDFSTLRPKGALISKLGVGASGPLTFMDEWDAMCRSIMSAGHRRGAMMGTLRCDHPDIEAFIEAKRDSKRMRMFNLSVLVTDPFMQAVRGDQPWDLVFGGKVYRTINARDLWDKIMRSTYDYADPGVIFIDRVNATNPLRYAEELIGTNPCAEKPLPEWGTCCLGSVNLSRMVTHPFTGRAVANIKKVRESTYTLVRMLDNVIDATRYPLPQQREEMMRKRRIGLGITGLADMMVMLGIRYGSDEGVQIASDIARYVAEAADEATQDLGSERGSFSLYDPSQYRNGSVVANGTYRRNSHLLSIAPTGTISLFAGNISSGIEPIFDLKLKRRILQKDNTWQEVEIKDYAYEQWSKLTEDEDINPRCVPGSPHSIWQTVADLTPSDHLNMLAVCQQHVDSSISKTINCPEAISFEDFKDIYLEAYKLGVKSCTTYRPNKVTGSILSSDSMSVSEAPQMGNVVELTKPLTRPTALQGVTYRLKPQKVQHALFITINDIEEAGRIRPFEIFISTKNLEFQAWSTALTRMISAIFRRGGDVSFICEELAAVFDPHGGGYWEDQKYVPSIIAGIGGVIEQHLVQLGIVSGKATQATTKLCPQCRGAMVNKEGCLSCTSCSHSACG